MKKKQPAKRSIPQKFWAAISRIDELKGRWVGGAQLNPQALGRLKRSVLVSSTGSSTRIEGVRLSDDDVEMLMRGLAMTKLADRDKQEARGYFELLENVFDSWRHIPLSENTVKHLHRELLKYSEKDERHRGDYKKTENAVEMFDETGRSVGVIFATTPAYLTPKRMQELVERTRDDLAAGKTHPLIVIGRFIVEFLAIHPFQDGNGRLARILTNLLMLHAGYAYVPYVSHEKLIENNKAAYYVALRRSQKSQGAGRGDISPWLEFFLKVILTQAEQAIDLLSRENIDRILSPKQLAVWRHLEQVMEATPGAISAITGVARPTVSQALDVLLRLKKVERIGQGRTTRYRKS